MGMKSPHSHLKRIAEAADSLEHWLSSNTGANSDWPIAIKADNEEAAEKISALLTDLRKALAPYRAAKALL
jgi:hypothetical protein